jgi:hypothetical protein
MAQRTRKRKRRGNEFQAPPKRGQLASARQTGEESAEKPADRKRARRRRERPPAPWGSFPLVELVVLLAIAMLTAGFFVSGTKGITMIATGLTLGMLAGLELSVREHFAGYKSHSTVLAGAPALVVLGLGFFFLPQGWARAVNVLVAAIVFASAFHLLREAFKRRSGGLGFR